MIGWFVCFGFTELIREVLIFFWDGAHVDQSRSRGGSCLPKGGIGEVELKSIQAFLSLQEAKSQSAD
jgi:hypothetical protein